MDFIPERALIPYPALWISSLRRSFFVVLSLVAGEMDKNNVSSEVQQCAEL